MENNKKIVFATGNIHKLQEVNEIAKNSGIEFVLPSGNFNPLEDGETFEQNSIIKARFAAELSNNIALADDSGLCVDALDGEPGIHSARYDTTVEKKINKLLTNLAEVDNRKAKFVCAMTLIDSKGNILNQEIGECYGQITKSPRGINGFGYDPIFLVDGYDITMAQMDENLKNKISHRAKALLRMIDYIKKHL